MSAIAQVSAHPYILSQSLAGVADVCVCVCLDDTIFHQIADGVFVRYHIVFAQCFTPV